MFRKPHLQQITLRAKRHCALTLDTCSHPDIQRNNEITLLQEEMIGHSKCQSHVGDNTKNEAVSLMVV